LDLAPLRPEFVIAVVDSDLASAEPVVAAIKKVGYQVLFYPTFEIAITQIRDNPPHIVVINMAAFEAQTESHLRQIHDVSAEILCLVLASQKQAVPVLQLIEKNLAFDYQMRPYVSARELLIKIDRAVERLYLQFEAEQLREATGVNNSPVDASPTLELDESAEREHFDRSAEREHFDRSAEREPRNQSAEREPPRSETKRESFASGSLDFADAPEFAGGFKANDSVGRGPAETESESGLIQSIDSVLKTMNSVRDLEQTIQTFLDATSSRLHNSPVLYFKYVPHYFSLVLSQSAWLPIEKIRGIGVELKSIDPAKIPQAFQNPSSLEPLRRLIREAFRVEEFKAYTHSSDGEILGVFVFFDPLLDDELRSLFQLYLQIFELTYKRNTVIKEKHVMEVTDPLTGLFNQKYFRARLDDEISRSRRVSMPISYLSIDIDGFDKIKNEIGFLNADTVLKVIAALLKKTSRANDIVGRVGPDDMALLLPHTGHMGAAIKAERVRRLVESTRIPVLESRGRDRISISVGVSEYPSFCQDAEGLIKSADEALYQVKQAGGNRVCLATPSPGFTPDFSPRLPQDVGRDRR